MLIGRIPFFLALFLLLLVPLLGSNIRWLAHSEKASGIMAFEGRGNAGDQMMLSYSVVCFRHGKDTIWFHGMGNLGLAPGTVIPVRYQAGDPSDAKVDLFISIWGATLVYGGIPLLMLICIFLHPDVVPRGSKIRLTRRKPFIRVVPPSRMGAA